MTATRRTPPDHRRLTVTDRAFLRYERLSGAAAPEIGVVLELANPITIEALRAAIESRLADVPELSIVATRTRWVHQHPNLNDQVRELVTENSAQQALEEAAASPLDPGSPLWRVVLIRTSHSTAVLFKAHHALFDGLSLTEACRRLFSSTPLARPETTRNPHEGRIGAISTTLRGIPGFLRSLVPPSGRAFSTGQLSGKRRIEWAAAGLPQIRALAHQHGATVNEVFLAALAGALRHWPHTPWRREVRSVWAMVPVDVRGTGDHFGNHIVGLRLRLPCDEPDPRRRLARVVAASRREKRFRLPMLRNGRTSLPAAVVRPVVALTMSRWYGDVLTTNRGWLAREPLAAGGGAVRDVLPIGVRFRHHPFSFCLGTFADRVTLQVSCDTALPRPDGLCHAWLDELGAMTTVSRPRY